MTEELKQKFVKLKKRSQEAGLEFALVELVDELIGEFEVKLQNEARRITSSLREEMTSIVVSLPEPQKGEAGDKGDIGEKGEKPVVGVDFTVPKDGKDGQIGKDGKGGVGGLDGKDGMDGKKGNDGSPDTPKQVIDKINSAETKIDASQIKNLPRARQISGAGALDGGGTANFVSKWSSNRTLTDSIIYDDGTSIGIGTDSPDFTLDVAGIVRATSYLGNLGNIFGEMGLGNNINGNARNINNLANLWSANVYGSVAANGDISISGTSHATKATSYVILQPTGGNVGIGTTTPQELLHVGTGTDASDITATDLLVTRAGPSSLSVRDSTNGVETFVFASSVGGIMGTVTNDPLNIQTNNTSAIFIDALQKVGIGTATPNEPLSVAGAISIVGDDTYSNGRAMIFTTAADGLNIAGKAGSTNDLVIVDKGGTGLIKLPTDTNFVTFPNGNVGIGVADPDSPLEVNGDTHIDGDLFFETDGSGLPYGSCYGNDIAWTQAAAINVVYNVSDADMTTGQLNAITHDGNGKLTVAKAGRYYVHHTATIKSSIAGKHIISGFEVSGSGNMEPDGRNHIDLVGANNQLECSGNAILDLAANATIEMAISSSDAGNPIVTVEHLNITAVMVGGT